MEETKLEFEYQAELLKNLETTKKIMEKQVSSFGRLLMGKISENYKILNQDRFAELLLKEFTTPVCIELDSLFQFYQKQELEFYSKNLKTADLIFNTLKDKRTQTIYLENIIKKINEKEENIQDVFTVSAKNKLNPEENEKHPSFNSIFNRFVQKLVNTSHLPVEESEKLCHLASRYYNLFQTDVASALGQLFSNNKEMSILKIDEEMDKKQIRNGKTSALSRIERMITNEYLKIMEKKLQNIVSKYKNSAKEELQRSSSSMVDLIFKLLPSKYQDQKGLIDVIIDTNINERLGKLLDLESEKLESNLNFQNKDMIENELYEEKRYKKIENYQCDLGLVDVVYQDVLHEICIAYDILEDDQNAKRLKIVLLSEEANSPKQVFHNFFNIVRKENRRDLNKTIMEMNQLSEKASKRKDLPQTNNLNQKK